MAARRFAQVDVFGAQPLRGNPVAVVLDGDELDDREMQRVANWTNLSETTFLLPPEQGGDYRVRIFTPDRELPFAGHPTLGSCHAWLLVAGAQAEGRDRFVQECEAGLVEVRRGEGGRLAFASPPLTRYEPVEEDVAGEVAGVLGLARDEIADMHWLDNGPGWIGVLLDSPDRVLSLKAGPTDRDIGVAALRDGEEALEVRAFFPADGLTLEDPVTGSLNAGLARWLIDAGRPEAPYVARQGTALDRAGRVFISQDEDGTIWVGGSTETVFEGFAWIG